MKYIVKQTSINSIINVSVILSPILYQDSSILAGIHKDHGKWVCDTNPSRVIDGPLSGIGEELENPIKDEYDQFIDDCKFLIEHSGFIIIDSYRSTTSYKSEYILVFGMKDQPCGKLVFNLRISDHPLDSYKFPEQQKLKALEYLKMNKILDGSAEKAGIDFRIDKVIIGSVKHDTWSRAINRLSDRLDRIRNLIRKTQK